MTEGGPPVAVARPGRPAPPSPGPFVATEAATARVQSPRHSVELQSLRGIAALLVLLAHASGYFLLPAFWAGAAGFLFNASAAVLSFFVLSGFVLTLSQVDRPLTVRAFGVFYLRRAFRIYPALWLATAAAVAYQYAARPIAWPAAVTRDWTDMIRHGGLDPKMLVETLLGKATELTLPVWTLFVELVGSLLMPIVIVVVVRAPWGLAALLALCIAAGAVPRFNVYDVPTLMTCFVYGAALVPLAGRLRSALRSDARARLLAAAALLPLWFGGTLFGLVPYQPFVLGSVLVTGLGAALLIGAIHARPGAFAPLGHAGFAWLGDISYSLYLLHMPVIGFAAIAIIALFGTALGPQVTTAALVLMIATMAATGLASHLSYRFVELPGIRLGKRAVAGLVDGRGGRGRR